MRTDSSESDELRAICALKFKIFNRRTTLILVRLIQCYIDKRGANSSVLG